jgi:pimeloyl-ACP methyl ester carboxylesterase
MSARAARILRGYTTCRYGQLHFLEGSPALGCGRAPTLILLHQNPSASMEYEPLLREMCTDRRVIAFDTPGYGMSDRPAAPLSISGYAAAFADGLDALGLESPLDVFGFHTGSLLAIELALLRPDRIARVALSGIPMREPEVRAARLLAARSGPAATDDGEALLAQSAALWRYVVTQRSAGMPLERAVAVFAEKNRTLQHGWWAYDGVWSYEYARLAQLQQPTLVVQPDDDLLEATRRAAALLSNVQFRLLKNLPRDALELGADEFAIALRDFFRSTSPLEPSP